MYRVTKTQHIRLDGGRSVVLREGSRGVRDDGDGAVVDLDEGLRKVLPAKMFAALLKNGTIVEE